MQREARLLTDKLTRLRFIVAGWYSLQCQGFPSCIRTKSQPVCDRSTDDAEHGIFFIRHQIQVFGFCIPVKITYPLQISGYAFCNLMRNLVRSPGVGGFTGQK